MANIGDISNSTVELFTAESERKVREAAGNIPVGEAGECEECGYTFERIVRGHCGGCRDDLGLE